jgi:hypothetical protein
MRTEPKSNKRSTKVSEEFGEPSGKKTRRTEEADESILIDEGIL